jgi:hypothetical protein
MAVIDVPELGEGQGEFPLVIETQRDLPPIKFGDGGESPLATLCCLS